jgi:hypothetical protein
MLRRVIGRSPKLLKAYRGADQAFASFYRSLTIDRFWAQHGSSAHPAENPLPPAKVSAEEEWQLAVVYLKIMLTMH